MKSFLIKNVENDMYVIGLFVSGAPQLHSVRWTPLIDHALVFENEEEAEATITFIGAVIDWELEELLTVVSE